jgi:hypothetical protein
VRLGIEVRDHDHDLRCGAVTDADIAARFACLFLSALVVLHALGRIARTISDAVRERRVYRAIAAELEAEACAKCGAANPHGERCAFDRGLR